VVPQCGLPAVTPSLIIACLALGIWLYLVFFRGGFWLARERDERSQPALPRGAAWPNLVVVIPARNEAAILPRSLCSLLAQDYAGKFSIIVVDDESVDGTAEVARALAERGRRGVEVLPGKTLPPSWTGKVWAMHQGIAHAGTFEEQPDYLLLTDADIDYAPSAVTRLVARAEASSTVLTSLMVKLNCKSLAERALIPAFVFFFQMLYPFAWVNREGAKTAAAAGGCMLVERRALARAGGIGKIRSSLIDDCALAQLMKTEGPIWLGLSSEVCSLRPYPHLGDIRHMVARSAYSQLRYSPLLLAVTTLGMALTYLAAPVLAIFAGYPANAVAAAAWALMTLAFLPILRFYRVSLLWAAALPLIASAYLAFTLDSAWQHWQGKGGLWKGRSQALAAKR
jgi:hopene-associated glycosyltransferase HpnB